MQDVFDKIYGATARQDGLTKIGRKKYEARFGYGEDAQGGYNYVRVYHERRPSLEELKKEILALVDGNTDERILAGYAYDGKLVWLSTENQFNYKAAYDLAVQTGGKSLPVTVKVGTTEEPDYVTFESVDEFGRFYLGALRYIQECLQAGWTEKDTIDWSAYECED